MKNIVHITLLIGLVIHLTVAEKTLNIIVDQFGYRNDARKVALISNPIKGQNAPNPISPGTTFQVVKVDTNEVVFEGRCDLDI